MPPPFHAPRPISIPARSRPILRAASRSRPRARIPSEPRILRAILKVKSHPRWRSSASRAARSPRRAPRGRSCIAERIEDPALPTVLGYGHGDVIRGLDAGWHAGPVALDADREGRPLLRARRGRQQGPAHDQYRRAGGGARRARQARLQRQMADRDGRGNRLARPARAVRRAQGAARGRRAGRLGRAAPHRRPPDDLARHARRLPDRPLDRCARGRASFGQLGRAALEPGDPARARALDHHGADRADPHSRMGAGAAFRTRCGARSPTAR